MPTRKRRMMTSHSFIYRRLCGRVILAVSLLALGASLPACKHTDGNAKLAPAGKPVKTAAVKKPAKMARMTKAKITKARPAPRTARAAPIPRPSADPVTTASIDPRSTAAPVLGGTWNYEYAGSRGTITFNADGTSAFNEPGLRKGSGKWQLRGDKFCQSFSGIKEPCVSLRQSGKAIYLGDMKLTRAE
jgi:hypothetical protein